MNKSLSLEEVKQLQPEIQKQRAIDLQERIKFIIDDNILYINEYLKTNYAADKHKYQVKILGQPPYNFDVTKIKEFYETICDKLVELYKEKGWKAWFIQEKESKTYYITLEI